MLTSEQIRAARMLVRWGQADLAKAARISVETVKRIEGRPGPVSAYASTVEAIRQALDAAGVEFIPENGGGPGVRLKGSNGQFAPEAVIDRRDDPERQR